jgi:hypothetical protein
MRRVVTLAALAAGTALAVASQYVAVLGWGF